MKLYTQLMTNNFNDLYSTTNRCLETIYKTKLDRDDQLYDMLCLNVDDNFVATIKLFKSLKEQVENNIVSQDVSTKNRIETILVEAELYAKSLQREKEFRSFYVSEITQYIIYIMLQEVGLEFENIAIESKTKENLNAIIKSSVKEVLRNSLFFARQKANKEVELFYYHHDIIIERSIILKNEDYGIIIL